MINIFQLKRGGKITQKHEICINYCEKRSNHFFLSTP
jgi:hypothetical protein